MRGTEIMSFALSDLLCYDEEDSDILSAAVMPESFSSDIDSSHCTEQSYIDESQTEESIAEIISRERYYMPGVDYVERIQSRPLDASAREESVSWILKVQAYYEFQPLTACLAVNYFDRFLYSHSLPKTDGWPMQLLSVACLSLAAKMEEPLVPSLLDLQVKSAKYIFEPRTIQRMELLVLSVLGWRLRSITPFCYLSYFAYKLDTTGSYTGFLLSRATRIILSNIQEASFLEYRPSCIAASAIICAATNVPSFSCFKPANAESWCEGISKEKIISCYQLMQGNAFYDKNNGAKRERVTFGSGDSSSSSTSSPCKRRKLSNTLWVDNDKGCSD